MPPSDSERAAKAAYYQANKERIDARNRARYRADPSKSLERQRKRRAADPEYYKLYDKQRKYGITPEQFQSMVLAQAGLCAICKQLPPNARGFHVDHDHKTGKIRGLLCITCNLLLGHAKDQSNILQSALRYLEENHREKNRL